LSAENPTLQGFVPSVKDRPEPDTLVIEALVDEEGNPAAPLGQLPLEKLQEIPPQSWDQFIFNLNYLNDRGVYHGDINEGNILWDGKRLRLIDFGRAELGEKKYSTHANGKRVYEDIRRAEILRDSISRPEFETSRFPRTEAKVEVAELNTHEGPASNFRKGETVGRTA
jgi:serine/threonine protein kinase